MVERQRRMGETGGEEREREREREREVSLAILIVDIFSFDKLTSQSTSEMTEKPVLIRYGVVSGILQCAHGIQ